MKRLFLILGALLFSASFSYAQPGPTSICFTTNGTNCVQGIQASNSVAISIAAGTTTELVALTANRRIFVTSFDLMANGTLTAKFVYGTGTACGTGTTDLTGPYPLVAQAGIAKGNGTGPILFVPSGNALCLTTSSTPQTSGSVSYVKF